jgi:hypothetical protein
MSRPSHPILAVVLLGIALNLGCGSNQMVTNPVEHATRPGVTAASVAPADAPGENPSAPGSAHGPSNVPPNVRITSPLPSALLIAILPQRATVSWTTDDPDGPGPGPKKYFYKILSQFGREFPFFIALSDPDSLRRFYSPDYPGWTEVSGKTTSFTLPNLLPNLEYLFVVTAVDRRGNEDPVFSLNKNMLRFTVGFAAPAASEAGADGEPQTPTSGGAAMRH